MLKNFFKLALAIGMVVSTFVSCSSEPQTISQEEITKLLEGKKVYSLIISSSGDLKGDYPHNVSVSYVENGKGYSQRLNTDYGLTEPKEDSSYETFKKEAVPVEDFLTFSNEKAFENAVNFIKKESGDEFENFVLKSIHIYTNKDRKGNLEVKKNMTIQATKKGEEASYEAGHRKINRVQNYYEFEFKILDNSEVEYKE